MLQAVHFYFELRLQIYFELIEKIENLNGKKPKTQAHKNKSQELTYKYSKLWQFFTILIRKYTLKRKSNDNYEQNH